MHVGSEQEKNCTIHIFAKVCRNCSFNITHLGTLVFMDLVQFFFVRLNRSSQTIFLGMPYPIQQSPFFYETHVNHRCCLFKKFPLVPYFGTPYTTLHRYCSHYKFIVFSFFCMIPIKSKIYALSSIFIHQLFLNYLFFCINDSFRIPS